MDVLDGPISEQLRAIVESLADTYDTVAREKRGRIVQLVGPAGSGRGAVLDALRLELAKRGQRAEFIRDSYDAGTLATSVSGVVTADDLEPLRDAVKAAYLEAMPLGGLIQKTIAALREGRDVLTGGSDSERRPLSEIHRLKEELRIALAELEGEAALVWMIDNIDAGPDNLMPLLQELDGEISARRAVLVVVTTSTPKPTWAFTDMPLATVDDVARYVQPATRRASVAVHALAEGRHSLVAELWADLRRAGQVKRLGGDGEWDLADVSDSLANVIRDTVYERLRRHEPDEARRSATRYALDVAAVVATAGSSRSFPLDVVSSCTGMKATELSETLDRALSHFVRRQEPATFTFGMESVSPAFGYEFVLGPVVPALMMSMDPERVASVAAAAAALIPTVRPMSTAVARTLATLHALAGDATNAGYYDELAVRGATLASAEFRACLTLLRVHTTDYWNSTSPPAAYFDCEQLFTAGLMLRDAPSDFRIVLADTAVAVARHVETRYYEGVGLILRAEVERDNRRLGPALEWYQRAFVLLRQVTTNMTAYMSLWTALCDACDVAIVNEDFPTAQGYLNELVDLENELGSPIDVRPRFLRAKFFDRLSALYAHYAREEVLAVAEEIDAMGDDSQMLLLDIAIREKALTRASHLLGEIELRAQNPAVRSGMFAPPNEDQILLRTRGRLSEAQGAPGLAAQYYAREWLVNPEHPGPLRQIAACLARAGRIKEAVASAAWWIVAAAGGMPAGEDKALIESIVSELSWWHYLDPAAALRTRSDEEWERTWSAYQDGRAREFVKSIAGELTRPAQHLLPGTADE